MDPRTLPCGTHEWIGFKSEYSLPCFTRKCQSTRYVSRRWKCGYGSRFFRLNYSSWFYTLLKACDMSRKTAVNYPLEFRSLLILWSSAAYFSLESMDSKFFEFVWGNFFGFFFRFRDHYDFVDLSVIWEVVYPRYYLE